LYLTHSTICFNSCQFLVSPKPNGDYSCTLFNFVVHTQSHNHFVYWLI
jgi:hypothetical protein